MDEVARARSRSFGAVADRYDRARPRYHPGVVATLVERLGTGALLLDVGCGTGILAVALGEAGFAVTGIEPDPAMAAVARRRLVHLPDVHVEEATFEGWVPQGDPAGTFDGITAGQSWHWVDPVAGAARAGELLRPGGLLALTWNDPRPEANDLLHELRAVYERQAPDLAPTTMVLSRGDTVRGLGTPEADRWFEDLEVLAWDWEQRFDAASFTDLLGTHSDHVLLDEPTRRALLDDIAATIDRAGGSFTYGYRTRLVLARRRSA